MVQLPNPKKLRPDSDPPMAASAEAAKGAAVAVKLEIEDPLEEENGPLNKRSKLAATSQEVTHYSLLEEPSPLGLRLRKSPSLLDLIQMRLSQTNVNTNSSSCVTSIGNSGASKKKELKSTAVSGTADKMKASNFPVNLLRIGAWECLSRYEGDLVAKCYFAKHKLVWEVLEGGLKSKIEIQWSDIVALKATCPENGPGTLDIVLSRPPLFFKETDPQPRKHTLWQATSDFTGGQASLIRRHFLQCPPSLLSKNFEKLIQCDPRLHSLSLQPDITLELPYFEPRRSLLEDQVESKCHSFDNLEDDHGPGSEFYDPGSPFAASPMSPKNELRDSVGRAQDLSLQGTPSPSSGVDPRAVEENGSSGRQEVKDPTWWDQLKVPGLKGSMSVSDLVNHIGHCISEQMTSGNPSLPTDALPNEEILEDIAQYLLSDSQAASASDEKSLMSRVNSLCCLLQKDPATAQNPQNNKVNRTAGDDSSDEESESKPESEPSDGAQPPISRNESFGELLMHLPRIASLPQFLFNISEDAENESG